MERVLKDLRSGENTTGASGMDALFSAAQASNPLRGEPVRTSPREDGRRVTRRKSAESVAEANGDVAAFMRELEEKRRQLDDQIHKYIASKEREFKLFERDLRNKYRNAQKRAEPTSATVNEGRTEQSGLDGEAEATGHDNNENDIRSPKDDGLQEERPVRERDQELLGLFTPAYLPLLEDKARDIDRPPSAPPTTGPSDTVSLDQAGKALLQRANTDPVPSKAMKDRPAHLTLEHRTSSSGSESSRPLISALRTSGAQARLPRRKRVSLVVGGSVVAPSEEIPPEATRSPGHSEQPQESQPPHDTPTKEAGAAPTELGKLHAAALAPRPAPTLQIERIESSSILTVTAEPRTPPPQSPKKAEVDVFDDFDPASSFEMNEDLDDDDRSMRNSSFHDDDDEIPTQDRAPSPRQLEPRTTTSTTTSTARNPSITISPFRASAAASLQPTSPGFLRPSVREDPQFLLDENEKVDDGVGYEIGRPSPVRQNTAGSLGESYMQRNAEQLMRRRRSDEGRA